MDTGIPNKNLMTANFGQVAATPDGVEQKEIAAGVGIDSVRAATGCNLVVHGAVPPVKLPREPPLRSQQLDNLVGSAVDQLKKGCGRTFRFGATLLPVPQRRHVDPVSTGEFFLGNAEAHPKGPHIHGAQGNTKRAHVMRRHCAAQHSIIIDRRGRNIGRLALEKPLQDALGSARRNACPDQQPGDREPVVYPSRPHRLEDEINTLSGGIRSAVRRGPDWHPRSGARFQF